MLLDIVHVRALEHYRLELRFEDGTEGVVHVNELIPFKGIFEPLNDPEYFASVSINTELGSIQWPNGADLDPDVLYAVITGSHAPSTS